MRALTVALVVLATFAAGGSSDPKPPSLVDACGSFASMTARSLWLRTADGVQLYAVEAGHGPVAVVLAHGGRSDLCEEIPYAQTLVAAGLRVLAFDFRGNGRSGDSTARPLALGSDLAAAVSRAHADGAGRVFLIGSSMGGAAAVQNGAGLPVAGIVSLSGTRLWPGFGINRPGPGALHVPFLYVGSRNDWRAPLKEARAVFRAVASKDKRTLFYPGVLHGWELVQTSSHAAATRALVLAWIHAHS
jgi:pimeloyl-ACP methyl ester carboxylesterase